MKKTKTHNIVHNFTGLKKEWSRLVLPVFLQYGFLNSFCNYNLDVKHLFYFNKNYLSYAQLFKLDLFKTFNYSQSFSIISYLFSFLKIQVLYLGNCYLTNYPSFVFYKNKDIYEVINNLNCDWFAVIVPDFLMSILANKKRYNLFKLEVEEDMELCVHKNWINLDSYIKDLKSKYRNRVKVIFEKSKSVKIQQFSIKDIKRYSSELQMLFDEVVVDAKFSGPRFNIKTFISLVDKQYAHVYGYFLNNNLVAFSSELHNKNELYAYYVGFNTKINTSHALYGRILIETINNAIKLNSSRVVFGRSASEFKSNFGAKPIKSYIFIGFKYKFFYYVFMPFLSRISIASWTQRFPFKTNN